MHLLRPLLRSGNPKKKIFLELDQTGNTLAYNRAMAVLAKLDSLGIEEKADAIIAGVDEDDDGDGDSVDDSDEKDDDDDDSDDEDGEEVLINIDEDDDMLDCD
ncbi:hypothetical protein M501DRAFT_988290 [Patellaria atrata CBS 101060]|uniref:Uncharacterized protein n=1 Tax=Patellaria atrata CBS 101060 TaxID=1346257 RepID=A0A9P4VVT8_9PEZI|nr:hypothetical protein M501DRAFT_988290 [Patellaria atrata CBS 101060]